MKIAKALSDELIYLETMPSGLRVAIHPKQKFQKTMVTLQVDFGGLDLCYEVGGQQKHIPAGVAHFLEHNLFSNNGRNLTEIFASKGARINAFTSKSQTSYTFDAREHVAELITIMLDGFITPDFSQESIEKERVIIGHELVMSDDSIHTDMFQKLKKMMYQDPGIRSDVGGTVKDISDIDQAMLNDVFKTFYHPQNMSLIVTGPVEVEPLLEALRRHPYQQYPWPPFKTIKRIREDAHRRIKRVKKHLPSIEENMVSIGITIPPSIFERYDRETIHIAMGAVIGNVFGLGSKHYDLLEKKKLMNISFAARTSIERDYGFVHLYIQIKNPKKYLETMLNILSRVHDEPLDEHLFNIDKNAILGNYIRLFDSLSRSHDFVSNCLYEKIEIDHYLEKILHLKTSDLDVFKAIFAPENIFVLQYLKK